MPAAIREGPLTFEEFCVLIEPDQKADLIDGVIYMASPEALEANELILWMASLMREYVRMAGLGGRVYHERVAFRLGPKSGPEPDIAYLGKARLHLRRKYCVEGSPDLAIEIVSAESVERDYIRKRALYEAAGVPEYWIVDPELRLVTVLILDRTGKYRETRRRKGLLRSRVLPGFSVRLEWLWQEARPALAAALRHMEK
jgi:Uma2 family endonuclease